MYSNFAAIHEDFTHDNYVQSEFGEMLNLVLKCDPLTKKQLLLEICDFCFFVYTEFNVQLKI